MYHSVSIFIDKVMVSALVCRFLDLTPRSEKLYRTQTLEYSAQSGSECSSLQQTCRQARYELEEDIAIPLSKVIL
jgi:hypothetical protein